MWPTHLRDTTLILVNRCRTILLISFAVTLALGLSAPNFALNVASADAQGTAHPYVTAMAMQQRAAATVVPADWSLIPAGLAPGDQFRLLFLSSTKRDGASSDIATYNTFIQNRAATGHADIQAYSSGFRALGCTAASDARDNTGTTYTGADKGISIYWLRGSRVAADYEDFYDGSWDDEANGKNESGANGPNTSQSTNYPFTGCQHDGTESLSSGLSRALGSGSFVRVGLPNDSSSGNGPIGSLFTLAASDTQPFYGLSEVFVVATPTGGVTVNPTEVTVNSGETEKNISFAATSDSDDDGESVKLTFGTLPTGVSEGTTNETVVSITDDDPPAFIRRVGPGVGTCCAVSGMADAPLAQRRATAAVQGVISFAEANYGLTHRGNITVVLSHSINGLFVRYEEAFGERPEELPDTCAFQQGQHVFLGPRCRTDRKAIASQWFALALGTADVVPEWMWRGTANYAGTHYSEGEAPAVSTDQLRRVLAFERPGELSRNHASDDLMTLAVLYAVSEYGTLEEWMHVHGEMRAGKTASGALESIYGASLDDFYSAFEDWADHQRTIVLLHSFRSCTEAALYLELGKGAIGQGIGFPDYRVPLEEDDDADGTVCEDWSTTHVLSPRLDNRHGRNRDSRETSSLHRQAGAYLAADTPSVHERSQLISGMEDV